ncbi:restriction endonuclease [bacterium]|nr:restriction endonuclease [bacterium]MBU1985401.1 restriction endonuclease [bacterium]
MAIPAFEDYLTAFLNVLTDGTTRHRKDMVGGIADKLNLKPEQMRETTASGKYTKHETLVHWANIFLYKAGLIDRPKRGFIKINEKGTAFLKKHNGRVEKKALEQIPQYSDWLASMKGGGAKEEEPVSPELGAPEEMIDSGYQKLRAALAHDILQAVRECAPRFFEQLVVDLLLAMGYGGSLKDAGETVGRTGDGGIDGIIKEDKLGLDVIYVQAKRWENVVGRPIVQAFAGSLEGQRAKKGVMITTSTFTSDAREFVKHIEKKIVLIDGRELAELMIDHNLGVSTVATYEVKKIDSDYFEEEI